MQTGVRLRHFLDKPGPQYPVSDVRRPTTRRGTRVARSCAAAMSSSGTRRALVLGGQCYRDTGLLEEPLRLLPPLSSSREHAQRCAHFTSR